MDGCLVQAATRRRKKKHTDSHDAGTGVNYQDRTIIVPEALNRLLQQHKNALQFFEQLSFTNKKEYVLWINGAKKEDTRDKRLTAAIDKLNAGKKNPTEK